jgi:hypothetical protein
MVAIVDQHTQGGEQLANSAKGAFHHSTLDCRLGGSDLAHSVPFSEYLEEEEGGGGGSLMLDRKETRLTMKCRWRFVERRLPRLRPL